MEHKAIALISGGLDSLLAARVIMEQGIKVQGVCFLMQFASRDSEKFKRNVKEAAKEAKIPVKIIDISKGFINVLRSPRHGYGANANPCIDCKIFMLKCAKEMMEKEKASFVITGEVLGERPMSQRKDALNIIKKKSGLGGYLVRPLSAKVLRESIPEKLGIVNREDLFDIRGRSRKPQLELAKKYKIAKFFAPAGGCLLTVPSFSVRVEDLIENNDLSYENVALLKYGRYFRLRENTKVLIGRDEKDNDALIALKKKNDIIVRIEDKPSPHALIVGDCDEATIKTVASLVVGLSKYRDARTPMTLEFWKTDKKMNRIEALPMNNKKIEKMRI